jgi:putative hemolysin
LPVHGVAAWLLPWRRLQRVYGKIMMQDEAELIFRRILRAMAADYAVEESALQHIPRTGPLVVIANHPFGILDGAIAGDLLARVRPDVKVVTNRLLAGVPGMAERSVFVDPFGTHESAYASLRGLKESISWLKSGGAIVIFPAGEVSHLRLDHPAVTDPAWTHTAARLIRMTKANTVPLFFAGSNSAAFHALGLVHGRLRTLRLMHEFVNAAGKMVQLRVGTAIAPEAMADMGSDGDATAYLRWRTYLLGESEKHPLRWPCIRRRSRPIPEALPANTMREEVEALGPDACLAQNGEFSTFLADAHQIPSVLKEIGRLREVTFRAVGEGTGAAYDLDSYDAHYRHLFIWRPETKEIVGGYRFAETAKVLPARGIKGLYTSSLFRYDEKFFDQLGGALELGRSFVRPEYQRMYAPLLMLWKGIARYVALHPQAPVLFGAVSISNAYNRASRELLVKFFEKHKEKQPLAGLVVPRTPFRAGRFRGRALDDVLPLLRDVEDLNAPLADIERDGKTVPILLKQYLKMGGVVLAFNVDRDFSDALDGLVFVDMRRTKASALARYMGTTEAAEFLQRYGIPQN